MDTRKVVVLSMLISGFCVFSSAQAEDKADWGGKRHEKMEKKIQEIYSQLNLTPEQKKALESNKSGNHQKRKAVFEKMRTYREALNQELMKPNLDMAKINDIQNNIKALQSQMADERLQSILAVRKILSVEQFTNFIAQMKKSPPEYRGREEKE